MNTSSGAEYAYFMDAFGGPPAFLFSWASTLVLKPSQMAIICLSFGKYAVEAFVTECEPPETVVKIVALLATGRMMTFRRSVLDVRNTIPFISSCYLVRELLQRKFGNQRAKRFYGSETGRRAHRDHRRSLQNGRR